MSERFKSDRCLYHVALAIPSSPYEDAYHVRDTTRISDSTCITITVPYKLSLSQPHIRQEYPLNLSILLSGGKENKRDSLSNGE